MKEFVNEKQQTIIATNVFGMGIDVIDIKIIMHANEPKMILNYVQKNKWMKQDGKRNEVMVVWGRIGARGGGGGGRRGRGRERKMKIRNKWNGKNNKIFGNKILKGGIRQIFK